jgi:multisubunit Na+/H+ antiporter MnhE subunit
MLEATAGFVAGFAIGLLVLLVLFRAVGDRVPAKFFLPLGLLIVWGSAVTGTWLARGLPPS